MTKNRIIPIFVPHIGCPHQCIFCDQRQIAGVHSAPTGEDAARLVAKGLERAGPGAEVAFYGGSFTAVNSDVQLDLLKAVSPFLASGMVSSLRVSTRPDAVDKAVMERLNHYGVQTVELGCQSMNDAVLKKSRRGHSSHDVYNSVHQLKSYGFSVILQMMTGLPGDSEKTAIETARELASLQPDGVRIYPTVVVRGSPLDLLYRRGEYIPQSVEETVDLCAKLLPIFYGSGIPVLRIGLQSTEALSGGGALAGGYHPALGELVKARCYRNLASALLKSCRGVYSVTLGVAPNRISIMIGQKRCNLLWLQREFKIRQIKVVPAPVEDWRIILQSVSEIDKMLR